MQWPEHKFGDLVHFPPKVKLRKGDDYPFIDMRAIKPFVRFVSSSENKQYGGSGHSKFEDGDVLMARISPCLENGKISQVKGLGGDGAFGSTEFFVFRPNDDKLDSNFLYYLSRSDLLWKSAINSMVGASGRQRADAKFLKRVCLKIPSLPIQRKIAAILTAYDDLIETSQRRIALLEKMAEELYREWFVRMRFPGHEKARFEKGVPTDWGYERLDKLCSLIKRGISPSYSAVSEMLVINQKCIRDGRLDLSEARTHNTNVKNEKFVQYGDALINSTGVGTLGRVSIVEFDPIKLTVDSHVTICRANEKKVGKHYLSHTICQLKAYFEFMAAGSTGQVELNRSLIAGIKVLIPSAALQNIFAEQVSPVWEKKQKIISANEKLTETRNLILPRLISGKLSVEGFDIQFPPSMQEVSAEPEAAHA